MEERRENIQQRRRFGPDVVVPLGALALFGLMLLLTFAFVFVVFLADVNLKDPVVAGLVGAAISQMFSIVVLMASAYYRPDKQ